MRSNLNPPQYGGTVEYKVSAQSNETPSRGPLMDPPGPAPLVGRAPEAALPRKLRIFW
jgi:hypothetical protein